MEGTLTIRYAVDVYYVSTTGTVRTLCIDRNCTCTWDYRSCMWAHAALVVVAAGCLDGIAEGTFRGEDGAGRSGDRTSKLDKGPPPTAAADPSPRGPFWAGFGGGCGWRAVTAGDGEKSISYRREKVY